jgi:hypothetical protein
MIDHVQGHSVNFTVVGANQGESRYTYERHRALRAPRDKRSGKPGTRTEFAYPCVFSKHDAHKFARLLSHCMLVNDLMISCLFA